MKEQQYKKVRVWIRTSTDLDSQKKSPEHHLEQSATCFHSFISHLFGTYLAILVIITTLIFGSKLHAAGLRESKIWFTSGDYSSPVEIKTLVLPSDAYDQPAWLSDAKRQLVINNLNNHLYYQVGSMTEAQNCAGLAIQYLFSTPTFTVSPDEFFTKVVKPWGTKIELSNRKAGDLIFFKNRFTPEMEHVAIFLTPTKLLSKDNHQPTFEIDFSQIYFYGIPDPWITNSQYYVPVVYRLNSSRISFHTTRPQVTPQPSQNCRIPLRALSSYSRDELQNLRIKVRNIHLGLYDYNERDVCEKLTKRIHQELHKRDIQNNWWKQ